MKSLCLSTKRKIDRPTTHGMQGPRLLPQAGQSKGRDKRMDRTSMGLEILVGAINPAMHTDIGV